MTNDKKAKLLKKVKNLLDLANDKNSLHEAETAARMAQELMMKYNLEEAQVLGIDYSDMEKFLYPAYKITKTNEGTWIRGLFNTVCKHNLCKIIINTRWEAGETREYFWILGEKTNIEIVIYICEQLIYKLRQIEKVHWSSYKGFDKRNSFRRGFLSGAVSGIYDKMNDLTESFKRNEGTNALIIRKDKQLQDFIDSEFPDLKKSRSSSLSSRDGFKKGHGVGKGININSGVSGGSQKHIR